MNRGLVLVRSCDNCVPGDSSVYRTPLIVLAVAGLVLGVGILLLARRGTGMQRRYGVAAALCLGIGLPTAVVLAHLPVSAGGATCGGALSASLERGSPTDAALDPTQSACRRRGQTLVDDAVGTGGVALLAGALLTVAAGVPTSSGGSDPRRRPTVGP